MTKTTTFKKGDTVWLFGDWDRKGGCVVSKITLTSMGKKQGTAIQVIDGQNIESRVYPGQMKNMILVSELADPTSEALARGEAYRLNEIKHYVDTVHHYALAESSRSDAGYFKAMKEGCQKCLDSVAHVVNRY